MRSFPAAIEAELANDSATLAVCWRVVLVQGAPEVASITQAAPAVVTTRSAHGLSTGDAVRFLGMEGMTSLNGNDYAVTVESDTTFRLNVDASGFGTHTANTGRAHKVLGFTAASRDLALSPVTFRSIEGLLPRQLDAGSDLAVGNSEAEKTLDDNDFTAGDFLGGVYDRAIVELFITDHEDPSKGEGKITKGWLGEITVEDVKAGLEYRDLAQALQQPIGERISLTCRAELGDSRCGVDLASYTVTGSVTSSASALKFTDTSRGESDGHFDLGLLTWTTGDNAGYQVEVVEYASQQFTLLHSMPYSIDPADQYRVYRGCDKKLTTCRDVFSNLDNMRAEPYTPLERDTMKYGSNI